MSFVSILSLKDVRELNVSKEEFVQNVANEAKNIKESIEKFSENLKSMIVSENDNQKNEINFIVKQVVDNLIFSKDPIIEQKNNCIVVNNTYILGDSKEELSAFDPPDPIKN